MSLNHLFKRCVVLMSGMILIITSFVASQSTEPVYAQDGDSILINQFNVTFVGRNYDGSTDQTSFTYLVEGTGNPPDLSHFDIEIPHCENPLNVVAYSPTDAVSFGVDPTTGVDGIKWDLSLSSSQTRTYLITFEGNVAAGAVLIAVKGGNGFEADTLPGGSCDAASVDVEKYVSLDGTTWEDADELTGLDIPLDGQVWFRFEIANDGNLDLSNLSLSDNMLDVSTCELPETLEPEDSVECVVGPFEVVEGQHTNVATVTATTEDEVLTDTDVANYWGGDRPSIDVEKQVTVDGGVTWDDADEPTGPIAVIGEPVQFSFRVVNDGNVGLTSLTLTDDMLDLSSCELPESLEPADSVDCIVEPVEAVEGQHTNTASVSAIFGDQTVSDSDSANYFGGEDDDDLTITIIIDGPVQSIDGNIIVIYGISIAIDPNDPILLTLQIGDVIQIQGDYGDSNIIIAVIVIVIADYDDDIDIDIDIDIDDDDDGFVRPECRNPPPPWAPAHGWRRKCE